MKDLRKKVVSNNPIIITPEEKMNNSKSSIQGSMIKGKSNISNRQELRIQKFKEQKAMKTFTQTANGFQHLEEPDKMAVLSQIANYKEK